MAYLGDGRWIEADPLVGRVVVEEAATSTSPWFNLPVVLLRWRALEAA